MELLLALAVITAVIIFGALISLGNERQRRAIDELREQVVLWAIQDLRIKREHLARNVRVEDPLGWFNQLVTKVYGNNLNIRVLDDFDEPPILVCLAESGNYRVIFTPLSPRDLDRLRREKRAPLNHLETNPLFHSSRTVSAFEISTLNGGMTFEIELSLAWKSIAKMEIPLTDRIWMYVYPE